MAQLEAARGIEFDRLFLDFMIQHHEGALTMVEELLESQGAAQEPTIFAFTSEVLADQSAEISRMASMLGGLSDDPRVGLAPGFLDAEIAISNMELVAALPKPPGFFDPDNPSGLPVPPEREESEEPESGSAEGNAANGAAESQQSPEAAHGGAHHAAPTGDAASSPTAQNTPPRRSSRLLSFANSDLAFANDMVFEGSFHGFNTYNVEDPSEPRLLASIVCPGGQGDVSVVGNLLIMSAQETRGRLDCGLQGVAEKVSEERFRGVRIFDISDVGNPIQVAAVQTCRGSHTHSVMTDPDDEGNVYVINSGTSSPRPGEELEGCSDKSPGDDPNTSLFSIDIIKIPMDRPSEARIVSSPRIFADLETGDIAGLWMGGDHGPGTQKTRPTNRCHDITVYGELGIAGGACSGNGILLDVANPEEPTRLDEVVDPGFAFWHSATFNNDGTKVIFTDEWGGGTRPRCRAFDPQTWGANAIFDIVEGKLEFRSYFKMPAPQTDTENCVAHNGSLVPVPGRDIMVQAWYQGGISVFDFTDSANPVEIAYFDRGPIDADTLITAGHWSAYWYNGFIYGTEIARGLDILRLQPSEYLTQNELDAAALVRPEVVNPQQQKRIVWPAEPVVARAYLDQLGRSEALPADRTAAITEALDRAERSLGRGGSNAEVASALDDLASRLGDVAANSRQDRARVESLGETLREIASRLR